MSDRTVSQVGENRTEPDTGTNLPLMSTQNPQSIKGVYPIKGIYQDRHKILMEFNQEL